MALGGGNMDRKLLKEILTQGKLIDENKDPGCYKCISICYQYQNLNVFVCLKSAEAITNALPLVVQ